MEDSLKKFRAELCELFRMDRAELDFGIYRIMNYKREEIENYFGLKDDKNSKLSRLVDSILEENAGQSKKRLEDELGVDPDTSSKVKELRGKLKTFDTHKMQDEVFSRLVDFFKRYYVDGDFICQPRYKKGVYAIPYEGEEVKLYWANYDQYYIKTSENFRNYSFELSSGKKVHFVLKEASTEQNNNLPKNGGKRFFKLAVAEKTEDEKFWECKEDKDLYIYFNYVVLKSEKDLQNKLIKEAEDQIRSEAGIPQDFKMALLSEKPSPKDTHRTLLRKHLQDYTAKNTFDYFIHKDLGGFLRRELDFYIKNEIILLDDFLNESYILSHLGTVKAIKKLGNKIIDFLAQLENFQKKLWLKKKFVVSCDYCITLDRVPGELYQEIVDNKAQREEWVRLFAIDEIKGDMMTEGYSEPLTVKFLEKNRFLVLDTRFFSTEFKHKLVNSMKNVDEECNGLLINSENFQGMNLLREKYYNSITTVITDPPYNTGNDDFLYKDNFTDSSWITMMNNRISFIFELLKDNSWCSFNINDIELFNLEELMKEFNWSSHTNITVQMSYLSGVKMSHVDKKIPKIKESILVYSKGDNYKFNPVYVPCSCDEAFDRYGGWVDFNDSENPEEWTRRTVKQVAKEQGIDEGNKEQFDKFRLQNANHIYQEATSNSIKNKEKDDKFHLDSTATGLKRIVRNGKEVVFAKKKVKEKNGKKQPVSRIGDIWSDTDNIGINNVFNEGGVQLPNGKKPVELYKRLVSLLNSGKGIIMDPFAGTGTTAHAVIEKIREEKENKNKYILLQEGYDYFNEKTKERVEKVVYSSDWKVDKKKSPLPKPVSRKGISQCFKYIRLEQYEDTLDNLEKKSDNLEMKPLPFQQESKSYESYMLKYKLDLESKDSLFDLDWFKNPFSVTMKINRENHSQKTTLDFVETFNYLIGLNVKTIHWLEEELCIVEGTTHREQEHTLVIWRNCEKMDNNSLEKRFREMLRPYTSIDTSIDRIYVNGDNTLLRLRKEDEKWNVNLTELEFRKRMFEA